MSCNVLESLVILDKDGVVKPVANSSSSEITGRVSLVGGNAFSLQRFDGEDNTINISVDGSAGSDDPVYRAKWNSLVNGTDGYSGLPYFIASVNRVTPEPDGTFFLLGGLCPQIGLFEDKGTGYRRPSQTPHSLELFDMCEACMDCGDYELLFTYTNRIEAWLDGNKDNNLTTGLRFHCARQFNTLCRQIIWSGNYFKRNLFLK